MSTFSSSKKGDSPSTITRFNKQKRLGRKGTVPFFGTTDFYQVMRYVERNALRAGLAHRAETWRWGSLWRRVSGAREQRAILSDWPLPEPRDWVKLVNRPETEAELDALRRCVIRSQPLGS